MESYGLESYEAIEIEDIVRRPNIGEIARNADYVVTDDKVMQVIDALDKMLISDEFKSLTGGKTLRDVLSSLGEKVYTDAFLNTILQYVYPLVANEFVKVWADLPESVEVDNPIFSGKLDVSLSLYTVEEAMKSIQVYVFPKILGEQIRNSYPEVAQKLMSVTEGATLQYNPWNDAAICDEDGKLALDWGITDRESFIAAATAGLKGLEPLLLALLANKQINNSNLTIEEFMSSSYTSRIGCGKVGTGSTRLIVNVTIDPIVLYLDVQGNSGYNNAIVPILEALSLPAEYIPDGNSFASVEDIIRHGLIEPISMALELLADAPIDFVTKALPNICYALELNMIPSLLSMLKTSISYRADAHYNAIAGFAAGNINNALVSDAPIGINIGEMLDLSSLGLDLSSLNGLLSLVEGLVDGLELPPIDGARFAGMGELEVRETRRNEAIYSSLPVGSAYFIKANQADVLIELLRYVINAVATDPSLIASLASAFGAGDDFVLPEAVDKIIFNVCHNTNDALAAVVELVLPQEYAVENGDSISWPTSFAMNGVSYPTDAWTKEKAKYVADNLPTFIDDILILTGIKIDGLAAENLNLLVEALLNKLYSPDLLNSLAQKLSSGLGSILPESLADILTQQLGVDFSYWNDWSCDFEVGDSAAFIDAACDLFSPFDAVLGCLLCNEDLVIRVNDENSSTRLIHVKGHDGYSFGLLPILEAIGAEMPSHAELMADRGNLIRNILTPIADRLEAVKADPYNSVADIVANVLYFASCDALEISMSNLLHAVYVVLDTISPVYKLNLNDLLGFDLTSLSGDYVVSFVATKLSAVIYDATGLRLYFDFSAGDLLSELGFGNLVPFTSANGSTSMRVDMTNADYADSLTVLLRYLLKLFVFSENAMVIAELCRERFELPDVAYAFLRALAFTLMNLSAEHIDYTLGVLFWIFYGADTAADAVAFAYSRYGRYDWEELVNTMTSSEIDYIHKAGYLMVEVYKTSFIPLYDDLVERYDIPINGSQITSLVKLLIDYIKLFKEFFEKLFGFLRARTA